VSKNLRKTTKAEVAPAIAEYDAFLADVVELLESARRAAARTVNVFITATYWEIGRRIVEYEQGGRQRAKYGEALVAQLGTDLTQRFGRGFSKRNLEQMRLFYLTWPIAQTLSAQLQAPPLGSPGSEKAQTASAQLLADAKGQTLSGLFARPAVGSENRQTASVEFHEALPLEKVQTPSAQFQSEAGIFAAEKYATVSRVLSLRNLARAFSLPWSHYVRLMAVKSEAGRQFYETEALRGGWTVRQLDRQINTQFYERTALSRNKAAMLRKGERLRPENAVTPEEEIKDPFVLEFLGLKDEYSESDLEEALIRQLESFLLELGGDFTFVGRQRRLRIGDEWYRIDLLFFHRRLRCLVVIDLKLGKFTHADAGQMHLYLNYAREHWTNPGENPPVGLILCTQRDEAVARYALEGLPNKVLAAEYRTVLPDEKLLAEEVERTRKQIEARRTMGLPRRKK
jgi:predicted nuclease of restriction endonuclease-like (RecB) superfamily